MVSRFECLPNEIQKLVYQEFLYQGPDLVQFMLVCKGWKILFQNILYKDVTLNSISRIEKFVTTIENNRHLSSIVKTLHLSTSPKGSENVLNTLFYLLPGVERIVHHSHFGFILNALTLNQLPKLKYISHPYNSFFLTKEEVEQYSECTLILKDRLEILAIVDWDESEELTSRWSNARGESGHIDYAIVKGDLLLENLHQFKNIQKLYVKKNCKDRFEIMENVTRDCTTVQKLRFVFNADIGDTDEYSPLNIIPASNVKSLKYSGTTANITKLLNYVMDKFPRLEGLRIEDDTAKEGRLIDKNTLERFLNYLLKLKKVLTYNIVFEEKIMQETIVPFWSIVAQTHLLEVEFSYPTSLKVFNEKTMGVFINNGLFMNRFYHPSDPATTGLKLLSYIEEFGHYFNNLVLSNLKRDLLDPSHTKKTPFELLVLHPLKHCNKLTTLSLGDCSLSGFNVKGYEVYKKQSFYTLRFASCDIEEDGFFETISRLFGSIKNLVLWNSIQWKARENDSLLSINVSMMQTNIENINIADFNGRRNALLLVNLLQGECRTYYMCDLNIHNGDTAGFETIGNEEYNEKLCHDESVLTINISCKSLKNLTVYYRCTSVKLITSRHQ